MGKKKAKGKGLSIKKWKGVKNDIDGFWLQNLTTGGQPSPKMANKLNITAPINFTHLGVNPMATSKGIKDGGIKMHTNLEKTMTYGTSTKRSFSNRYYTETSDTKGNSNSLRMSCKAPSGLSNISDSENFKVPKKKKTKLKKISSNRGSTKPVVVSNVENHRSNNVNIPAGNFAYK